MTPENASNFAFVISYIMLLIIALVYIFTSSIKKKHKYEYGTCNNRKARRSLNDGSVQFILWKAGQQGHKEDFWIEFDSSWWSQFKRDNK